MPTAMVTTPAFPSSGHEKLLKERLSNDGWKSFTVDEKSWWHSYVYPWRQEFLDLRPDSPPPTDRLGEWFMPRLVAAVRAAYACGKMRGRYRARGRCEDITPAMQAYHRGDYELAEYFDDQDRERRYDSASALADANAGSD